MSQITLDQENRIDAQTIAANEETVDCWAYVEIFGHNQLAGRLTTRKFGTQIMFQIDVPKGDTELSHSEMYSPNSIFSIKPTTEAWCRKYAKFRLTQGLNEILPYIPQERQLESPRKSERIDDDQS
jgi:hypothetical protein